MKPHVYVGSPAKPYSSGPFCFRLEVKMPAITFRAKVETVRNRDGSIAFQRVKVPALTYAHCNMEEWRQHPKWGVLANSDLFIDCLRRQTALAIGGDHVRYLRLDRLPAVVSVDASGFLARVTINLDA